GSTTFRIAHCSGSIRKSNRAPALSRSRRAARHRSTASLQRTSVAIGPARPRLPRSRKSRRSCGSSPRVANGGVWRHIRPAPRPQAPALKRASMGERAEAAPAAIGSAFEPTALNRRSTGARFPLKVAALNLRGSGQVEAIAARLRRPPLDGVGVLLLSEVAWHTRWSGRREVAAELASILGMSFIFAPSWGYRSSHDGPIASLKGCAILSAQPLIDVATPPIPALPHRHNLQRRVDRQVGITASIVIGGREIKVGVVHLSRNGSPQFRARQMEEYLAAFSPDG